MLQDLIDRHGKESVVLLTLSAVLILTSFVAPYISGGRQAWNEHLAVQYKQAQANYHNALIGRAACGRPIGQCFVGDA